MQEDDIPALRAALRYDQETGRFTGPEGERVERPHSKGYIVVEVLGRQLYGHRLAWALMTGQWPARSIDHRDQDRSNNRFDNLREAGARQQMQHSRMQGGKALRLKGVRLVEGRYQARIMAEGKRISLGVYGLPDEAAHAYNKAAIKYFGEFAVLNPVGRGNKEAPRGAGPERRKMTEPKPEKKKRGFAAMTPERRREIAASGGKAAQAGGKTHKFTSETGSEAGKKGGPALQAKIKRQIEGKK